MCLEHSYSQRHLVCPSEVAEVNETYCFKIHYRCGYSSILPVHAGPMMKVRALCMLFLLFFKEDTVEVLYFLASSIIRAYRNGCSRYWRDLPSPKQKIPRIGCQVGKVRGVGTPGRFL